MKAATPQKKNYTRRNTAMFYALMAQVPGYSREYQDVIKEGIIDGFLTKHYGSLHGREVGLSKLTDGEYRELINEMKFQIEEAKSKSQMRQEATRKRLVYLILNKLSEINVSTRNGFDDVNYHIKRIPFSKGRIIPQITTDELEGLLGAVRGYCDGIKKQQLKEMDKAFRN
ncbi:hypothetical protein LJC38_00205 [Parabacteroides sp. OttesenSCG-928-K15]|nr:hypothetical protein [Parabacteroides sp. OttesenSCG-928-K15]